MYNKIHDHFKTILLLLLVMYAAVNYHEAHPQVFTPKTKWNTLINQYETFNTFDRINKHNKNIKKRNQCFDDSHPII